MFDAWALRVLGAPKHLQMLTSVDCRGSDGIFSSWGFSDVDVMSLR